MSNTRNYDLVHIDSCADTFTEDKQLSTVALLDENCNHRHIDLEEIYLGQLVREENCGNQEQLSNCGRCQSKMATVRSYLQSRKQYLSTALLLICVTIYLPYCYMVVLDARQQHLNGLQTSSGFQKVTNRSHVLFSAYLDGRFPREPAKLRILGFKNKKDDRPLYCKVYLKKGCAVCLSNPAIELRLNPKNDQHLDTQCLFHCTLPDHMVDSPVAITLTSSSDCQTQSGEHVIPVHLVQGDPKMKKAIAVCFSTPAKELRGTEDQHALIEILELSRYFGAESVQMYNESMGSVLPPALEAYIKTGFLTLHPWNVGNRYLPHVARALSVNDCIYRNVAKFRNIVFVDRDQIILPSPSYNSSWLKLAHELMRVYPSSGAFWFQQVLYISQKALPKNIHPKALPAHCPLNRIPSKQLPRLFTHRFLSRPKDTKSIQPTYSQVIVDPTIVLYVDTNMRISFLPGKNSKYLTTEVGQSVKFVKSMKPKKKKAMETLETFRSSYSVKLTTVLYNRLGYQKALNLSACVM